MAYQTADTELAEVKSVSIKLPEFWHKSPEVWFVRIESQFNTKNIIQDQTKYDYVVSSLSAEVAEEVQAVLLNPSATNKYINLKKALIKTFGKSQAQKDLELLNLNGLGDRKPTALLRKINALNDDPQSLKRALFLSNLPSELQTILAAQNITDIEALAEAADHIWEARTASSACGIGSVEHTHEHYQPELAPQQAQKGRSVDGVYQNQRQFQQSFKQDPRHSKQPGAKFNARFNKSGGTNQSFICVYHSKFGPEAFKCQPGCKFSSLISKPSSSGVSGKD